MGNRTQVILDTLQISAPTLNLWRRFRDCGVESLKKGKTRLSRVLP